MAAHPFSISFTHGKEPCTLLSTSSDDTCLEAISKPQMAFEGKAKADEKA
jgi:hypothetical protein